MARLEEYTPPTAATQDELDTLKKSYPFCGDPPHRPDCMNDWDSNFIYSLHEREKDMFVLLLSKKQRFHLDRIYQNLYDAGLVT